MRFLIFNLVVVGALFYLLAGGEVQQAQTLWKREPAQAMKQQTEQIIQMTKEVVEQTRSTAARTTPQLDPVKTPPSPQPVQQRVNVTPQTKELPPLDGEQDVQKLIAQKAPNGVSPGIQPRTISPTEIPETTQVDDVEKLISSGEKRQKRKKELNRMVFDMERLFAEKLTR